MSEHYYAVIMAGGGGTRLWPLSRQTHPKQMLHLIGEQSLFQTSVRRLEGVFPPERICVVTVQKQAEELKRQCPEIPPENFFIEPMPRGTASVVGLAAIALQYRDPQAVMAILTSDHYMGNVGLFHKLLLAALEVAQEGHLVTLGITPNYPATGYGYIHMGDLLGRYNDLDVYRAVRFKEKPDEDQARDMLEGGDHVWNSGMFVWRTDKILDEFTRQMPELHTRLTAISRAWGTNEEGDVLHQVWPQIEPETIDYGIMENAENVSVIPATGLDWSDVGSWDSLFDVLPLDDDGNIVMSGQHISLDTKDSLVCSEGEQRLVVTIGIDDLMVIDTGDVLLVCKRNQAQMVRQIVDQLKETNRNFV
jgi:mannose-1-phosphate guanylyltransferase